MFFAFHEIRLQILNYQEYGIRLFLLTLTLMQIIRHFSLTLTLTCISGLSPCLTDCELRRVFLTATIKWQHVCLSGKIHNLSNQTIKSKVQKQLTNLKIGVIVIQCV